MIIPKILKSEYRQQALLYEDDPKVNAYVAGICINRFHIGFELCNFRVEEKHRGRGYGSILIDLVTCTHKTPLILQAGGRLGKGMRTNMPELAAFYERHGFFHVKQKTKITEGVFRTHYDNYYVKTDEEPFYGMYMANSLAIKARP